MRDKNRIQHPQRSTEESVLTRGLKMSNATVRESRTQSAKLFPGLGNMEVIEAIIFKIFND